MKNRAAAEREVGTVRTRMWIAYLAGCAIGFDGASIGIFQTLAIKRQRGLTGLPPTRGTYIGERYCHAPRRRGIQYTQACSFTFGVGVYWIVRLRER